MRENGATIGSLILRDFKPHHSLTGNFFVLQTSDGNDKHFSIEMTNSGEDNKRINEPSKSEINIKEESIIKIEEDSAFENELICNDVAEEVEVVTETETIEESNKNSTENLIIEKLLRNTEISLKKVKPKKVRVRTNIKKLVSAIRENATDIVTISKTQNASDPAKVKPKKPSTSDLVFCEECDKFLKKGSFEGHKRYVHKKLKPHLCPTCGYAANTASILRQHIQAVHVGYTFLCDECPMKFNLLKRLRRHKKYKHSKVPISPEKRHVCQYCGHRFEKKFHLTNHIRKHTNETPFQCEYCDKKFKHKWSCVQHTRLHNKVKPEKSKS